MGELLLFVIIFTDAAYEDGKATWDIVAIALHTGTREVIGGLIPSDLVARRQSDGALQIIAQAEAFALLLAGNVCICLTSCWKCLLAPPKEPLGDILHRQRVNSLCRDERQQTFKDSPQACCRVFGV